MAVKDLLLTLLVEIIQISVQHLLQLYVKTQYCKDAFSYSISVSAG